jgi:hypothetical protein
MAETRGGYSAAMAFIGIPEPGSPWGPCLQDCGHEECVDARRTAALVCSDCGNPIGYGTQYYIESLDWSRGSHMTCALNRFERQRCA